MRFSRQNRRAPSRRKGPFPGPILFLPLVLAGWFLFPTTAGNGQTPAPDGDTETTPSINGDDDTGLRECRPGPWGHLEYYVTYLEALEHLVELMPVPSQHTLWHFVGMGPKEVWDVLLEAGVSQELREELDLRSAWYVSDEETRILPNHQVLVQLSPSTRRQIYTALGQWKENPLHRNPILVDSGSVRQWLNRANLPADIVDLVAAVTYPHGTETAFSDVPLVLSQLAAPEQERRFLKAITRTRSLVVRIRLNGEPNLDSVAEYWSSGHRFKDSLPLLESVVRPHGVDRLDIAHFLPPVPRKHLYTYPSLQSGQSGRFPDSFWSVFNFFEFWPDETPQDAAEIDARLQSQYHQVDEASRFGDVLVFRDPESKHPLHGCVFLAADIVYTKDGAGVLRPWILTRLPDLIRHWSRPAPPVIEAWRPNRIPEFQDLEYRRPGAVSAPSISFLHAHE